MIELIRLIENEVSWCIFAIDIVPCLKVIVSPLKKNVHQ